MVTFVDQATVHVAAGEGGNGCASVHREKFKPLGGPDGGNGGNGGDVILVVDPQETTLLNYHRSAHRRAPSGRPGQGGMRNGAAGDDLVLPVPDGTVVKDRTGTILADLVGAGTRFVVAAGGRGGLGNAALASPRRKAPGFALLGEPGGARDVVLELKTIADVGLVGFPSAGKSSLVAVLSAARPKIADYPFTTLVPNLGVVQAGDVRFTVADVPGLIPGASQGKGLGLEFLRHVERCAALVHVLDCATSEPGRDPISDLEVIDAELAAYDVGEGTPPLTARPRLVVLHKVDVPDARDLAELVRPDLEARGLEVLTVSSATHEGLRELSFAMARLVARARADAPPSSAPRITLRPAPVDDVGFTVSREHTPAGELFRVRGDRPERWVRQTDFSNDEAVGYLADRLARLGVEEALLAAGAVAGAEVVIGGADGVVFDWEPTLLAGGPVGTTGGPRGGDARLTETTRPSRGERRERYEETREARRVARHELEVERAAGLWTTPEDRAEDTEDHAEDTEDRAEDTPADQPAGDRGESTAVVGPEARRSEPGQPGASDPDQPVTPPLAGREDLAAAARVVVKVGSSSLTTPGGGIEDARLCALVDALAARRLSGCEVVLVTSGAIAAGLVPLELARRPRDLATQQAAASVGQGLLMGRYTAAFGRHGLTIGQVLLTADDVVRRGHYANARRTLFRLLGLGVVPVVNENDTVATEEIRFGDNDRLAALVAHLVQADALVLLSDVDALYDGPPTRPGARRIAQVDGPADLDGVRIRAAGRSGVGTGGMVTKVEAATIAVTAGIPALLTSTEQVQAALAGEEVGTWFTARGARTASRLLWLAHAARSSGRLVLDEGAVAAVVQRRMSLLPAGIVRVDGRFSAGEPVDLVDPDGKLVGRGLVNFDAQELPALLGRSTRDLARELGAGYSREVVHRDDLVVLSHRSAHQSAPQPDGVPETRGAKRRPLVH